MDQDKEIKQKYFSIVVSALAAQGWKQALDENGRCTWMSETNHWTSETATRRCAIGHLLPLDVIEHYQDENRAQTIESAIDYHLLPSDLFDLDLKETKEEYDPHRRFAGIMQTIHDACDTPEGMEKAFKDLGQRLELTWPLPT